MKISVFLLRYDTFREKGQKRVEAAPLRGPSAGWSPCLCRGCSARSPSVCRARRLPGEVAPREGPVRKRPSALARKGGKRVRK